MAEILPTHWEQLALAGANPAEIHTLRQLAAALPDDYSVVHGVHWSRAKPQRTIFGEIDFCVLSPSGRLLLIEQKNGPLVETDAGLFKEYGEEQKDVARQVTRSLDAVRQKFKETNHGFRLDVEYLLFCPDYRVRRLNSVQLDRRHIVDATRQKELGSAVRELLGDEGADVALDTRERVRDFLLDSWQIYPDVNAFLSVTGESYTRLSGGLTTWAHRLRFTPFRLRVSGAAGSGKTQLALSEFRRCLAEGGTPTYVCFNHPLAARLRTIEPSGGRIQTFHAICEDWIRQCGGQPDFSDQDPDFWQRMVRWAARLAVPEGWTSDVLIIDEGQDFEPEWAGLLLRLARPDSRVLWLEDPSQNLYGRASVDLPGFVQLDVPVNHRSPWRIHVAIENLLHVGTECANPLPGYEPDYISCSDEQLLDVIEDRIERFIRIGFKPADIAIVSFKGFRSSAVARVERIGNHTLKSWTGEYDEKKRQVFRQGQILFDSIHRFKGQQAPAIIFCEIDFEHFDDSAKRRLYCGMTRASVAIDLLMTPATMQIIARALPD